MASDDTMTFQLHSSVQDEDFDNDIDDGYEHHHHHHHHHHHPHPHPHNLSRLSVCTTGSTICGVDDDLDDDDVDNSMAMYVSALSIEGDADGEFSDGKDLPAGSGLSSDSETELGSCYYSMPPRLRRNVKDYASDNEAQKGVFIMGQKTKENDPRRRRRRRRRMRKGTWVWESSEKNSSESKKKDEVDSGESDQSGSTGLRVMTRPKGGRRSLYMDMEEVKACRDLGFELEIPSRLSLSFSNSTLDTHTSTSGATSPIANMRISSPGDDPRDVKARLKMWAQAVAASASKYGTS